MHSFLKEIHEQPGAVLETAAYLSSEAGRRPLGEVGTLWRSGRYSRILATGMGSSFFTGSSLALLLEGSGVPAFCINAGQLLHHGLDVAREDTLLVAISQSGESYETVKVLQTLNLPPERVVAITNTPGSRLAALSGHVILTKAGEERMTSTKTFITAWQAALAFAGAITGKPYIYDALSLSDGIRWILSQTIDASPFRDVPFIQFTARGIDFEVAQQSALMSMEALHLPASALTGGDFRHGPLEMVAPEMPVVVISHSESPTAEQSLRLARDVSRFGGHPVLVADKAPDNFEGTFFEVPDCDLNLFPILAIIPLQLLVCGIAEDRGIIPGDFYHGGKVTSIE